LKKFCFHRIEKAIETDNLLPVDETVKHSSSAVDTVDLFYLFKDFWKKLDWPEAARGNAFVRKIIDVILRSKSFWVSMLNLFFHRTFTIVAILTL
jgi:hypothetical protein